MEVTQLDAAGLRNNRREVVDLYADVYRDKLTNPFDSLPRFEERLAAYETRAGFTLITGRVNHELIGYAMGFPLPPDTRWWSGLLEPVDQELTREDGHRTLGITEIMVRADHRRRQVARTLHHELLQQVARPRSALLVLPGNEAAHAAYRSWGYVRVGALRPTTDAPVYDAMLLDRRD